MAGSPPTVAQLDSVSYAYDDLAVLEDLSVTIHEGITGLVGVNGAGKTTLFNVLAGMLAPTHGEARVCGADGSVLRGRARASAIGVMPQSFVPPSRMSAQEFLTYLAWLKGVPRSARAEAVADALARVDLADKRHVAVTALSGGMQRRLLLAQTLLGSPRLLLLDEPTAGLDPEQRVKQRSVLGAVAATAGAILISSHLIEDLVQLCDRVLVLDQRRLVFDGSPADLLAMGSGLVAVGSGLSPYEAAFLHLTGASR